ncbi:hypothetical protein [Nocardia sp. BMG51109]|uniref:hypothetical protein n=1 Tax=Nocardia sp. BMG51109 TaxID=1056816 RepID=UPI0004B08E66|nr:hypothetical protein [Nocardia sp. BMG51109]
MPDDEEERRRKARDSGRRHNERGRHFHLGMAHLLGETLEKGWRYEQVIKTDFGDRIHDTARADERGREFSEYKSGRVGPKAMRQAAKDRNILERDPNARGTWVVVQGAQVDREVREELAGMVRDFGDRFRVLEVGREEAKRARELGRVLEERSRGVQRDLHDVPELVRRQRQRERAQRIRAKARTQEMAQRAIERAGRDREAQQRADRGKELEPTGQWQEREPAAREADDAAGAARRRAVERTAELGRQAREAAAAGQVVRMTQRDAADLLAVSKPLPGEDVRRQDRAPRLSRTAYERVRELERDERGEREVR